MMSIKTDSFRRCNLSYKILLMSLIVLSDTVLADISVYDQDDKKLDFQLEIQGGGFANSNSWFGESKSYLGENTDAWAEAAVEMGFSGEMPLGQGTIFGEVSGLGTITYGDDASGLNIDEDSESIRFEQAHIGWKSGNTFSSLGTDALTVKAGKFDYLIGTGLIIADGSSDGGDRGGWWIGARKAFKNSFLASLDTGPWLLESFYLENSARSKSSEGKTYGVNTEYDFVPANVNVGISALRVDDKKDSDFDDFDVYSLRADWTPLASLVLSGEYVYDDLKKGDAEGWYAQSAYQWNEVKWTPALSYRYASLDGDDLDTAENDGFRTVAYGFTDYGTWYQGEIAGNYPLDNSNLDSHMVRLQLSPNEDLDINVIYYKFTLAEKHIFGDPVADDDFGDEIDVSVDWAVNDELFVIGTIGVLFPGDAAKDLTGGDDKWLYSMIYLDYRI